MYRERISNPAEKTPCTAPAVFWGVIALIALLALVAAFLGVWACCLWLPLWTVWPVAAGALACCFWIGWKSI